MRFYSYNSEPTETMQQLAALNRFLLCKLKTLVEEPPRIRGTEEEEKTERKRKKQRLKESGRSKRRRAFKKRLRRSKGFYGQQGAKTLARRLWAILRPQEPPCTVLVVCAALPRTRERLNTILSKRYQRRCFLTRTVLDEGLLWKTLGLWKSLRSLQV